MPAARGEQERDLGWGGPSLDQLHAEAEFSEDDALALRVDFHQALGNDPLLIIGEDAASQVPLDAVDQWVAAVILDDRIFDGSAVQPDHAAGLHVSSPAIEDDLADLDDGLGLGAGQVVFDDGDVL